jgi:L-alanine-DL-glutamate epimerase-like enolase superfamily enzyme
VIADVHNVRWCVHASISTPIHLAAGLHLAAATPNFLLCEYPQAFRTTPLANDLVEVPLRPVDGHLDVSDAPGLGIKLVAEEVQALSLDRIDWIA